MSQQMTNSAEKLLRACIEGIRARQELNIPQDSANIYALCDYAISTLTPSEKQDSTNE